MSDAAVRQVAEASGVEFETLRVARHLRNALAHDEPVNRAALARYRGILVEAVGHRTGSSEPDLVSPPSDDVNAYRVHAWRDPQLELQMIANGFVSIGGDEIGDLTGLTDAETIRDWLTESMPDRSPRAISLFVGYWRRFLWEAAPGDLVVLPSRARNVAIGEFVGPYHFVKTAEPHARHRRAVSWIATGVDRDAFDADLVTTLNGQHTVQEFEAARTVRRLRSLADVGVDPGPPSGTDGVKP
jgi:predicted Mrr-cat superfamily restriction endonuclease